MSPLYRNKRTGDVVDTGAAKDPRLERLENWERTTDPKDRARATRHDPTPTTGDVAENPPAEDKPAGQTPDPDREELLALTRAQLDDRAGEAGVEEPEKLPNKEAVADAIREKLAAAD